MAALSASDVQAQCDALAKHVIDLFALASASQAAIIAGQATNLSRIAALNDAQKIGLLLDGVNTAFAAETAWLNQLAAYNSALDAVFWWIITLSRSVPNGISAFLQANSLQVDPHFLDAHNRAFARQVGGVPTSLMSAYLSFGQAIAQMATVAVTGSTTGNYTHVADQAAAYGNAPLSIYNAGGGNTGASSTVFTVTYSKYDGSGNVLTGQTATATMPNGSAPNTAVALSGSAAGFAVTNIAVTSNGNSGDTIGVKATLLRAVTY